MSRIKMPQFWINETRWYKIMKSALNFDAIFEVIQCRRFGSKNYSSDSNKIFINIPIKCSSPWIWEKKIVMNFFTHSSKSCSLIRQHSTLIYNSITSSQNQLMYSNKIKKNIPLRKLSFWLNNCLKLIQIITWNSNGIICNNFTM